MDKFIPVDGRNSAPVEIYKAYRTKGCIYHITTGAGSLPSTVSYLICNSKGFATAPTDLASIESTTVTCLQQYPSTHGTNMESTA